jgi:hypothetical protein
MPHRMHDLHQVPSWLPSINGIIYNRGSNSQRAALLLRSVWNLACVRLHRGCRECAGCMPLDLHVIRGTEHHMCMPHMPVHVPRLICSSAYAVHAALLLQVMRFSTFMLRGDLQCIRG